MEYDSTVVLRDGRRCRLRSGAERDGRAALACFDLTHAQTDWLASYPDENAMDEAQEARFLRAKAESLNEVELLAEIDGRVVGLAGIESLGAKDKVKHRASFGISIDRDYWGLGVGRALTRACVECARAAGYRQLELEVVAENERAVALYRSEGFVEYGRNPRGMRSRLSGWQEIALMRLELDGWTGRSDHEKVV